MESCDILLAINANSVSDDIKLNRIVSTGDLCDIIGSRHGIDSPPTYLQGSQSIDFLFGTTNVQKAAIAKGYLPFNEGIRSDHRGIWMDINLNFFSYGPIPELSPAMCRLTTKNKKWVALTKERITKRIVQADIRDKLDNLQSKCMTNDNRPALIKDLESIDCLLHDAMITDVSKGIHMSPTWWSPDLRNEKLGVSYWELRRVQRITGMCMAQAIQNILDQLPPDHPLQNKPHTSNIEAMIRRSKLRVRDAVRHSFDLRQQFLIQLHTEYDTAGEEEKARQITALKNNELKQMSYRKIKRYIKSIEPTQLTYVDVESNGSTTRVTQKKDLEETLLAHHKQHFSQAADTPFAQPEVLQRFGIAADTEYAIAIRQGDNR